MPTLGRFTECIKLLLSQASKDMHDPLIPIFLTVIGAYIIGTEFQYPDNIWKKSCGIMADISANMCCNFAMSK
jgi:hypothetical protein